MTELQTETTGRTNRMTGVGRLLVVVYAILALAATGRSTVQIIERFGEAPVAFSLSALSAVVYIVATIALVARGRRWYLIAWSTITFELAGVLIVGTLSVFAPSVLGLADADPFGRHSTVWSVYGMGYLFIPLVLPVLGLWWLARHPLPAAVARDQTSADQRSAHQTSAS
jgi:hypothetical protein